MNNLAYRDRLFQVSGAMRLCVVYRKVGLCISYELYDEASEEFLMSCVSCPQISPMMLFLAIKDCHLRRFEDICCNLKIQYFIAKMVSDWMTGTHFKLTSFDEKLIAQIRYLTKV